MSSFLKTTAIAAVSLAVVATPSVAADKVRFINSTKVVLETEAPYAAKENGIFEKYGLDVSIIHGSGGAASLQTIITGSQDLVWGNGVLGVMAAYAKGAPVRILGSVMRGVGDLYWYVKTDSPIKKFQDLNGGKELAYSRPGSTTHLATLYLSEALKLSAKLVSVGGPSGARTQLMSGQVASGWSVFPLNNKLLRQKKIRIIGTGTQAAGLKGITIRVAAANSNWLEKNRGVARRMMNALFEGQLVTYTSEKQMRAYAKRWKQDYEDVKDTAKYVPLTDASILPVAGLQKLNEMAVRFKRIKKPLTAAQLKELFHPMGNKPN